MESSILSHSSDSSAISPMTPLPEDQSRSSLLRTVQDILGDEPVTREMRAFCELCEKAYLVPLIYMTKGQLITLSNECKEAIYQWGQRVRNMEGDTESIRTNRSQALSNKTKDRDGYRCVLTIDQVVDVCHIFPYCLGKNMDQRTHTIWRVLERFWGIEGTTECQEAIFGPPELIVPTSKTLINSLANLICLEVGVHAKWSRGFFAFKHISGGSHQGTTSMVLELEWLAAHPELSTNLVRLDQAVELTSIAEIPDAILINARTRQFIQSGYQFTLSTDNPEVLPLPDERLIDLQWFLTRVLRMSGAGDINMGYDDTPIASPIISTLPESPEFLEEFFRFST